MEGLRRERVPWMDQTKKIRVIYLNLRLNFPKLSSTDFRCRRFDRRGFTLRSTGSSSLSRGTSSAYVTGMVRLPSGRRPILPRPTLVSSSTTKTVQTFFSRFMYYNYRGYSHRFFGCSAHHPMGWLKQYFLPVTNRIAEP